jgi:hypothetical protein
MTPFILILALIGPTGELAQLESAGAFPSGYDCAWAGIAASRIAEVDEKRAPKAGVRFVCVPTNIDAAEAEIDVIHAETEADGTRALEALRDAIRSRAEPAGMASALEEASRRAAEAADAETAPAREALLAEQAAARERLRAELRPILR